MRLKDYLLNELFTSPIKTKLKQKNQNAYTATFKIDDYIFEYIVTDMDRDGTWEISFSSEKNGQGVKWSIEAMDDPKDALKVFSTVVYLTKQFIEEENPEIITYSSNIYEFSRIKLYDKFISWMKKGGYILKSREQSSDGVFWTFEKE